MPPQHDGFMQQPSKLPISGSSPGGGSNSLRNLRIVSQTNMKTKICGKCEEKKAINNFSKNKSRKSGLNGHCKECHSKYLKAHYQANKDYYLEKAKKSNKKIRDRNCKWVRKLKEETPCADCDKKYPYYVMDFDHLDPSTKYMCVGRLIRTYSEKLLRTEIAKCELVCSNCHRERTHKRLQIPSQHNGNAPVF